jgi:hypothetical protein
LQQEVGELLGRLGEGEAFTRPVVDLVGDRIELGSGQDSPTSAVEVLAGSVHAPRAEKHGDRVVLAIDERRVYGQVLRRLER